MAAKKQRRMPSLRHHKASGQGFVELNGRYIYLGKFGLPETEQAYRRKISEWIANGRKIPVEAREITIAELILAFWTHANDYYSRRDGTKTSEVCLIRSALRPLRSLYGDAKAVEFGPLGLKTVRERMVESNWARTTINEQIRRIVRMFRWAAENELVPHEVHHRLSTVSGLRKGRCDARETDAIRPVSIEHVEAVKHTNEIGTQKRILEKAP